MKIYSTKALFGATLLTAVTFLSSCQKEELLDTPKDKKAVSKAEAYNRLPAAQTKQAVNAVEMQNIVINLLQLKPGSFKEGFPEDFNGCAFIEKYDSALPYTAILDFGTGCTEAGGGKVYSGKITAVYNSLDMNTVGDKLTATFHNFKIDNVETNGTMVLEKTGDGEGSIHLSVTTNFSSGLFSISGDHTYFVTTGNEVNEDGESVMVLRGSGSGITTGGLEFSNLIDASNPMVLNLAESTCKDPIIKGALTISTQGESDKFVDYGTGSCDNVASVVQDNVRTLFYFNED